FSPAAVLKAGNSTGAGGPVTQPPQLTKRQPPKTAQGFGARSGSGAWLQKGFSAMNFRILAAARPRGRAFALLAATTLSASLAASVVLAQTPAPAPGAPAAPKAPPAAPKAPAAAPKAAPKGPAPAAQQAP